MNTTWALGPLALAVLVGCGDAEETSGRRARKQVFDCPIPTDHDDAPPGGSSGPSSPHALAFTTTGELALVNTRTGAVVSATSPTPRPRADAGARDVAYDASLARAIVYVGSSGADRGEITTLALLPHGPGGHFAERAALSLGPSEHRAWVDGDARVLPVPGGIVAFEVGLGARWRLLRDDGSPSASTPLPPPASAWTSVDSEGMALHALVYAEDGGAALERISADIGADGLHASGGDPLGVGASTLPPTARLADAPGLGASILVDIDADEGRPSLRPLFADHVGGAHQVPAADAGRVEHALALDDGRIVVLLTNDPARIVAVVLDDAGRPRAASVLGLPGTLRRETRFFSRDLLAVGPRRLLVATDAGVFGVEVKAKLGSAEAGGPDVGLTFDEVFVGAGLRGPLAAVEGSP